MSVAQHLRIRLEEYDRRIRTFIPAYDEMISAAASALHALPLPSPRVIDLGTGTGALAAACARVAPGLSLTLLDADADILAMANARLTALGATPLLIQGSFADLTLPNADAVVASLALHHLREPSAKQAFYARVRDSLVPNGLLITADCHPSREAAPAEREFAAWRAHLGQTYSETEVDAFFAAWAEEDTYMPLPTELELIRQSGFAPATVWRRGAFAVIAARIPPG